MLETVLFLHQIMQLKPTDFSMFFQETVNMYKSEKDYNYIFVFIFPHIMIFFLSSLHIDLPLLQK